MAASPFDVVRQFEDALCEYTGAPYCVTTTSCTVALLLACSWRLRDDPDAGRQEEYGTFRKEIRPKITIPKRTYVGVPMSIIHAGGWPVFEDFEWRRTYRLNPLRIWDSARWLGRDMWSENRRGEMVCLSFHWNKPLGIGQGGAILHDNAEADEWLRMARFDGRTEGVSAMVDQPKMIGWHAYMTPEQAAAGLVRLGNIGDGNDGLTRPLEEEYPDLSEMEVFRG